MKLAVLGTVCHTFFLFAHFERLLLYLYLQICKLLVIYINEVLLICAFTSFVEVLNGADRFIRPLFRRATPIFAKNCSVWSDTPTKLQALDPLSTKEGVATYHLFCFFSKLNFWNLYSVGCWFSLHPSFNYLQTFVYVYFRLWMSYVPLRSRSGRRRVITSICS